MFKYVKLLALALLINLASSLNVNKSGVSIKTQEDQEINTLLVYADDYVDKIKVNGEVPAGLSGFSSVKNAEQKLNIKFDYNDVIAIKGNHDAEFSQKTAVFRLGAAIAHKGGKILTSVDDWKCNGKEAFDWTRAKDLGPELPSLSANLSGASLIWQACLPESAVCYTKIKCPAKAKTLLDSRNEYSSYFS